MNHPYLAIGQDVNYVTGDGKIQKGKVNQVLHEDAVRIEWDGNHEAIAEFSDGKEPGTFHFADTQKPASPIPAANAEKTK